MREIWKENQTRRDIIIFISGAYIHKTEEGIDSNIKRARSVSAYLWEMGYTAYCPHLNTMHFEKDCKVSDDEIVKGHLVILRRCDVIFMLDGYIFAPGAINELEEAGRLDIPVFFEAKNGFENLERAEW